ncbi:MAG: hypothetical protein HY677_06370 [Chloroflexi bacterium]|nr:hypothetical protein [Chloroflexota bacterium]
MLNRLRQKLENDRIRKRIARTLNVGVGLYAQSWTLQQLPIKPEDLHRLGSQITNWCSDVMAHTSKPYGIDQVKVGIACARPGQRVVASSIFGVFRQREFAQEGGPKEQIESFVSRLHIPELNASNTSLRFAAVLLSYGDVAKESIFNY